jgi:urease accessory protein UreH
MFYLLLTAVRSLSRTSSDTMTLVHLSANNTLSTYACQPTIHYSHTPVSQQYTIHVRLSANNTLPTYACQPTIHYPHTPVSQQYTIHVRLSANNTLPTYACQPTIHYPRTHSHRRKKDTAGQGKCWIIALHLFSLHYSYDKVHITSVIPF